MLDRNGKSIDFYLVYYPYLDPRSYISVAKTDKKNGEQEPSSDARVAHSSLLSAFTASAWLKRVRRLSERCCHSIGMAVTGEPTMGR